MRLRVLIFEDEPLLRNLLWTVSTRRGYEVFGYPAPGLCPLNTVGHCPCPSGTMCADVIISDIQMPGVNGLDFLQRLIDKQCRRPQLALMSGSWTEEQMERAQHLGCKIIEKPFQLAEVIEWFDQLEKSIPPARRLFDWNHMEAGSDPPPPRMARTANSTAKSRFNHGFHR
jgi:DNA-binding response OmpR family regulator